MIDLHTSRGMASSIGLLFQLLTTIFALTLLLYGEGLSFVVLIIPTLFLFSMSMSSRKRDDYAMLMFKLAVLLQSVLMWLSLFSDLFGRWILVPPWNLYTILTSKIVTPMDT